MRSSKHAIAMEPEGEMRSVAKHSDNVVALHHAAQDYESFNLCHRQSDDPRSPRAHPRSIAIRRANEFREFGFIFGGLLGFALLFAMALSLSL